MSRNCWYQTGGRTMEIRFRLEEVIRKYDPTKLRKGLFMDITNWSKHHRRSSQDQEYLERHKLSELFHNRETTVSLKFLNLLCEYLIAGCQVPEHVLPHEL